MRLAVVAVDPPGFPSGHWSRDLARLLCGGLGSAGYDCILARNQPEPGRLNVVVCGHRIGDEEHLRAFTGGAIRYVVVQTEHLLSDERARPDQAARLQRLYLPLLQRAEGIWEPEPMRLPVLETLGLRGSHLQLGFDASMRFLPEKIEQDVDFTFFGTITAHRQQLLVPVQRRGHDLRVVKEADPFFRNDLLARTKVHLAPRRGDGAGRVPLVRLVTLLANRCLVVAEQGVDHHGLEDCLLLAPTDRWVEVCEEALGRPDRRQLAQRFADRFEQRPMSGFVGPLVEALV